MGKARARRQGWRGLLVALGLVGLWLGLTSGLAFAVTPTPTPEATPSPTPVEGPRYVVRPGDTLFGIAIQFGVDLDELRAANQLGEDAVIYPGDEIILPMPGVSGYLHTVDVPFGEDAYSLTRRYQMDLAAFTRLNGLVSPYQLYAGRPITVPGDADGPGGYPALARVQLTPGESVLELALARHENPWHYVLVNRLASPARALPDEVLVTPAEEDQGLTALPPQVGEVRLEGSPWPQGETWEVWVRAAADPGPVTLDAVQTQWRGRGIATFPWPEDADPRQWVVLGGVHPMAWVEPHPLRLTFTLSDGRVWSFEQEVPIREGNFGFEEITVPEKFLDVKVAQEESAFVTEIMRRVTPEKYWDGVFRAPSPYGGDCINSLFGTRRKYNDGKLWGYHAGVDLCGGYGTPILAPAAGKVVLARELTVRGGSVIIDHGWGVVSGYWHMNKIEVQEGDWVEPGQEIGKVGSTGRSTGPHLHWELWVGGVPVNPLPWLEREFP